MAEVRSNAKKFQAPKGTRDFYPQDMAVRRYIESVWRRVSINHGFDEVEGPMFEDIELYKHKSGPGIVSEIFQVYSGKDEQELARIRSGGDAPFALRPEFTPTLARMVAARAAELPRPIKWFAIPQHFRAERPQRGRLREFIQWNVDFIGDDSPRADAEVIATAVAALQSFGLGPEDIRIKVNNREAAKGFLQSHGVPEDNIEAALAFIDKCDRLSDSERESERIRLGISDFAMGAFQKAVGAVDIPFNCTADFLNISDVQLRSLRRELFDSLQPFFAPLHAEFQAAGVVDWCRFNTSIVRGLAYYTGTVFEIHEVTGQERAIAGGGRYDNLIESFGGLSLPACGFGMGDVVLGNLLHDKGLLSEDIYMRPLRPHAFVITADDNAAAELPKLVSQLRRSGFHIRHSYKSTRNVGKLLGEANKSRAMSAIILGEELAEQQVQFKDLQSGEQMPVALKDLEATLRALIERVDG